MSQLIDCTKCGHGISWSARKCPKCHFPNMSCRICKGRIAPDSLRCKIAYVDSKPFVDYDHCYHIECVRELYSISAFSSSCATCGSELSKEWYRSFLSFESFELIHRIPCSCFSLDFPSCQNCGEIKPVLESDNIAYCVQCSLPIFKFHEHIEYYNKLYHATCIRDEAEKSARLSAQRREERIKEEKLRRSHKKKPMSDILGISGGVILLFVALYELWFDG